MQMVAASKMRKAQESALSGRPYAEQMNSVMKEVAAAVSDFSHPLMEVRSVNRRGLIVISTDKGLCGALNTNLLREVSKYDKAKTLHIVAGRKSAQFVARTKREMAAEFSFDDSPKSSEARQISMFAQDLFLKGEVDAVDIAYTEFVNTLTQIPVIVPFLPITDLEELDADLESQRADSKKVHTSGGAREFIFEPNPSKVLGALLPHYLNYRIYQVLLESKASEHSARMVAMKNATDNAKELIKGLTLQYNKLRQANITSELLEITTAQMALGN